MSLVMILLEYDLDLIKFLLMKAFFISNLKFLFNWYLTAYYWGTSINHYLFLETRVIEAAFITYIC